MERKKIHLEYLLNATSKSILWAARSEEHTSELQSQR